VTPREKLNALRREYEQREQQYRDTANSIPTNARAVKLTNNRNRFAIIHRSTYDADKWQVSFFDQYGAIGHATRNTRTDAIITAMKDYGYTTIAEVI
jgi:hypothetical protein